ncbi:ABC transporter ATP-binding protein [Anoxynatronum buryatiense]|uniref:Peptide/nickel transport system ATP-binding protein/oligopeptide transport system ATP-binding protein n=1 Tax=Anoxynatronum buryatiense TaxID=489973 RepID=A0AA45WXG1_9CLOT|nr:ABC transporter ATP-binding protein [Anoxynatronum buryatiense]SMP62562.1 peptide/nickel transport system ATP-binding protein/oligopeptide transport system ATP-binding protein [Anoxynatronum buryatiense]
MDNVVELKNLKVTFVAKQSFLKELLMKEQPLVRAVDGVNVTIKKGEILSLVGESGSGKTTLGKAILNLVDIADGEILFQNQVVNFHHKQEVRRFRQKAQVIFQDPYQSLNPKSLIIDIVAEPLEVNRLIKTEAERNERVMKALHDAGLDPPERYLYRYPYELSGGQRQRVAIASALILNPEFIVADEPVSMLDVSIRTGILKLLVELKESKGLTFLFITHDLSLAWLISDRIAIMYLGKIMEIGESDTVIKQAVHPYTQALLEVMPIPEVNRHRQRKVLSGETPNPTNIPAGCRFHPRCPHAFDRCREEEPVLQAARSNHLAACHLIEKETSQENSHD